MCAIGEASPIAISATPAAKQPIRQTGAGRPSTTSVRVRFA